MKIVFDTNIWISAFIARGLCADLVELALAHQDNSLVSVAISRGIQTEVFRLLESKFCASPQQMDSVREVFRWIEEIPDSRWRPPQGFPDPDDAPIIGAALGAGVDLFITGDKALLELGAMEGMPIVNPREAYLRLRGLA